MLRRTAFFWIASIPIQGMLIALYKQAPEQLSAWYSNYIFLGLLRLKSPVFNSLPFSFGDVAYGSTIVFCAINWSAAQNIGANCGGHSCGLY